MKKLKNKTKTENIHFPLVITGYSLFTLLVIGVLLSTTIPFGMIFLNPNALHGNVAVALIALTAGALLPTLVGYLIGDHAIKSKSKVNHHFTGMLFGLLAYWIMILLSAFIVIPQEFSHEYRNITLIVLNILPTIGVILIAVMLAVSHVRSSQAKQDLIEFKPFAGLLIASAIALPLGALVQNIFTNTTNVYSFVPLLVVLALGLISYWTLRGVRVTTNSRIVWSAVSVSVLFVAMFVIPHFVSAVAGYIVQRPTVEVMTAVNLVGYALAVIVWLVYWTVQVKSFTRLRPTRKR